MPTMKKKQRSAAGWLEQALVYYLLILIVCLFISVISIVEVSRQNKRMFQTNLDMYAAEISDRLENVHYRLLDVLVNTNPLPAVPEEDLLSEIVSLRALQKGLTNLQNSDGRWFNFFFYRESDGQWATSSNQYFSYDDWQSALGYLNQLADSGDLIRMSQQNTWTTFSHDQSLYVIQLLRYRGFLAGAWIRADRLMAALQEFDQTEKAIVLPGEGDLAYTLDGQAIDQTQLYGERRAPGRAMTVTESFRNSDFQVQILIVSQGAYERAFLLQILLLVLSLLLLIIGMFFLCHTQHSVLRPLKEFSAHLDEYAAEGGMPNAESFLELQQVNRSFQRLLTQLQDLKIRIYEEKLQRQQVEYEYLQAQIQPHFYLNCLNIIYHMATSGRKEEIGPFIILLSQYLRALFRNGMEPIPLSEELQAVDHYLTIQKIRYGPKFHYQVCGQDGLDRIPIAPFTVLTMVENSIKHNLNPDGILQVSLEISRIRAEGQPYLQLVISDTGSGFPPQVLEALCHGDRVRPSNGRGIGIWNTLQRIRLIYGGRASVDFANRQPHGALVTIRIPLFGAPQDPHTPQEGGTAL